jgi:short-subunit dehydrogenase
VKKVLVLGASKGLGAAVAEVLSNRGIEVCTMQRTSNSKYQFLQADFTKQQNWESYLEQIMSTSPDQLIYCAGGGPFGEFTKKKFSDHEWAYKLNLLFPAFLIHTIKVPLLFTGSAIAENQSDAKAASYASAKHGLLGLIRSVKAEDPMRKLKLFSPGYMDTSMLPLNAWPRQQGLVLPPGKVAQILVNWIQSDDESFHKVVD